MNETIERYRKQLEVIQKKHGPTNYVDQLKAVEFLIEYEVDEDIKFLFEQHRDHLQTIIQLEHLKTLKDTGETIIGIKGNNASKNFEIKRDGNTYSIATLKKNAILLDIIMYCLSTQKNVEELNAKDYRNIGVRSCNDGENVRATLVRIKKNGLPVDVQRFLILHCANLNFNEGIIDKFPFLNIKYLSAS